MDQRADPGFFADALRQLAARVAELEREVAALKRASPAGSEPVPPPIRSLPVPVPVPVAGEVEVPTPPPPLAATPPQPRRTLEDRLGSQVFNRVGIVALLVAASWGLRLAFENQWIGPLGRVLIGLLAGTGLVLWSESFRRKGFDIFSWTLKAVGTGVLYLALWASYQVYAVLPAAVALQGMVAVTGWTSYLAWAQDSELLAAYALTGALATPLLLSTGGNHEAFLFSYLLTVDLATLLLVRLKPWPRLLLAALAGTASFYFGWYAHFYGLFTGTPAPPFGLTSALLLAFAALFALPSVRGVLLWEQPQVLAPELRLRRSPAILAVLVPVLNAAFLAAALSLLVARQYLGQPLPWLMAALAGVYLLLTRVQRTGASAALHLALALVFLTLSISLKASGHTLVVALFAEGLALLWASTRAAPEPAAQRLTTRNVLLALSFAGYVLGLLSLCFLRFASALFEHGTFFDADLLTMLFSALSLGLAAVLLLRTRQGSGEAALLALAGLDAVAVLLATREFDPRLAGFAAFRNPLFGSALVALGLLAAAMYLALRLPASDLRRPLGRFAAATSILFHLTALCSVVAEIDALWLRSGANLQRSLAISAFLMAYGAALLVAGFLRRSAWTRWQALVLILFTVCKVFLYDMSSLSQGYRVLSFLALGVLLLAVSFAYQRDWLGLKASSLEANAVEHKP